MGFQASTAEFCNVCSSSDVATGFKQCLCHKRAVSAIIDSLSGGRLCYKRAVSAIIDSLSEGLSPEGQQALTDFKTTMNQAQALTDFKTMMNQAPSKPPSQFAETVLDFESKYPGRGSGKRRGSSSQDSMRIVYKHRRVTPIDSTSSTCLVPSLQETDSSDAHLPARTEARRTHANGCDDSRP